MKHTKYIFVLLLAIVCGCAAIKGDKVIVNAERSISITFDLADSFLKWEHANRSQLPPDVTSVADSIRIKFPPTLAIAKSALDSYKTTKSETDKDRLVTWLATLRSMEEQIRAAYKP